MKRVKLGPGASAVLLVLWGLLAPIVLYLIFSKLGILAWCESYRSASLVSYWAVVALTRMAFGGIWLIGGVTVMDRLDRAGKTQFFPEQQGKISQSRGWTPSFWDFFAWIVVIAVTHAVIVIIDEFVRYLL